MIEIFWYFGIILLSKAARCICRLSVSDVEGEENDVVELEKSNVLLMGPTGSGAFEILLLTAFMFA